MTKKRHPRVGWGARQHVLTAQECCYCGSKEGPFVVDHVVPRAWGGTNERSNLACACYDCNADKSDLLLVDWKMSLEARGIPWPPTREALNPPAGPYPATYGLERVE